MCEARLAYDLGYSAWFTRTLCSLTSMDGTPYGWGEIWARFVRNANPVALPQRNHSYLTDRWIYLALFQWISSQNYNKKVAMLSTRSVSC